MTGRYTIENDWQRVERSTLESYDNDRTLGQVIWESATLTDTRDGRRYTDGAHRVRIKSHLAGKPRGKTFTGETAYSHAENYFDQCKRDLRRLDK